MSVYAKRLNSAQRRALLEYEGICGFEPMGQDDLDDGRITFDQLWAMNLKWLEDVLADVNSIDVRGTGA